MEFGLTREQQKVIAKAERVAKDGLAPNASDVDEMASHPVDSWNAIWQGGLLAATAPREYGGMGLGMLTSTMVLEKLASGCASTAAGLNMHLVVLRYIDALATPDQKGRFYSEVVEGGKLFGSWGSEPGRHGGVGVVNTLIARVDGGYVIDGGKQFCTMAGACHRAMVHCNMPGPDGEMRILLAMVPSEATGLEVHGDWNTLGMRGTVSPRVDFRNCLVDNSLVLGEPGQAESVGVGQSFGLGDSAIYIGIAQAALDYLINYVSTHSFAPDPDPLSHNLIAQRGVAEMTLTLEAARLVLYRSASMYDDEDVIGRAVLVSKAKYLASEAVLTITSRALQLAGGRMAHKRYPLERLYRDARTSTLMPPNPDRCLEILGKSELGLKDQLSMLRQSS